MRIFNKKKPKLQNKRVREEKDFNPYERKHGDKMTEVEKMDKGFNGSTYSINGLDIDF